MNIQIFNFNEEKIQVLLDGNNEPWWVATEVCSALSIKNTSDAVNRLYADDRSTIDITDSRTNNRQRIIINEFGLYDLVLVSRTKRAKKFKYWITHEVLPSIRRTGSYSVSTPQNYLEAMKECVRLEETRLELEAKIEKDKPKVKLHDAVMDTNDTLSINEMAKLLGTGQKRLFSWLREQDYLMSNNLPYQPYLDRGYFVTKEIPLKKGYKSELYLQTRITPKGQVWLSNKFN